MSTKKEVRVGSRNADTNDRRIYDIQSRISETNNSSFQMPLRDSSEIYIKQLGHLGEKILRSVARVDGIVVIDIGLYHITVEKARLFDWDGEDGIEAQICMAIEASIGLNGLKAIFVGHLSKYNITNNADEIIDTFGQDQ